GSSGDDLATWAKPDGLQNRVQCEHQSDVSNAVRCDGCNVRDSTKVGQPKAKLVCNAKRDCPRRPSGKLVGACLRTMNVELSEGELHDVSIVNLCPSAFFVR